MNEEGEWRMVTRGVFVEKQTWEKDNPGKDWKTEGLSLVMYGVEAEDGVKVEDDVEVKVFAEDGSEVKGFWIQVPDISPQTLFDIFFTFNEMTGVNDWAKKVELLRPVCRQAAQLAIGDGNVKDYSDPR